MRLTFTRDAAYAVLVCMNVLYLYHHQGQAKQVALVGGCLLDLGHGVQPKDYDLMVPCGKNWDRTACFQQMQDMSAQLSVLGYSSCVYQAYEQCVSDYDEHLYGGMQVTVAGVSVDILFYKADNVKHGLSMFDCTMNQLSMPAKLLRPALRMAPGDLWTVHLPASDRKDHYLLRKLTPERTRHIFNKAQKYGLTLHQPIRAEDLI